MKEEEARKILVNQTKHVGEGDAIQPAQAHPSFLPSTTVLSTPLTSGGREAEQSRGTKRANSEMSGEETSVNSSNLRKRQKRDDVSNDAKPPRKRANPMSRRQKNILKQPQNMPSEISRVTVELDSPGPGHSEGEVNAGPQEWKAAQFNYDEETRAKKIAANPTVIKPKPWRTNRDANGHLISSRADGIRASKRTSSRVKRPGYPANADVQFTSAYLDYRQTSHRHPPPHQHPQANSLEWSLPYTFDEDYASNNNPRLSTSEISSAAANHMMPLAYHNIGSVHDQGPYQNIHQDMEHPRGSESADTALPFGTMASTNDINYQQASYIAYPTTIRRDFPAATTLHDVNGDGGHPDGQQIYNDLWNAHENPQIPHPMTNNASHCSSISQSGNMLEMFVESPDENYFFGEAPDTDQDPFQSTSFDYSEPFMQCLPANIASFDTNQHSAFAPRWN